jgi:uncharacterized membrane protein YadS
VTLASVATSGLGAKAWSRVGRRLDGYAPGVIASIAVAGLAWLVVSVETRLTGRAWIEGVVSAILIGGAIATLGRARPGWALGVNFSARRPLEIAIALLGASVSPAALAAIGPPLLAGLVAVVVLSLLIGYGLWRVLRGQNTTAMLRDSG